jgi:membrane-bound serine protease (ClpP class)
MPDLRSPHPSRRRGLSSAFRLALFALLALAPLLGVAVQLLAQEAAGPEDAEASGGRAPVVIHARIADEIHPVTAEFVAEVIEAAEEAEAEAVVFELSTPGGVLTSTREITSSMLESRVPVVVWVAPRGAQAASAGFFILMAAEVAAMAPETNTGAAHPVAGGGQDIPGVLGEKAEQDASANIRALAARQGRNEELAVAAVVESRSFTAQEALEGELIDLIAPSLAALLREIDGREVQAGGRPVTLKTADAEVREIEMTAFRRFLSVLANPNIAAILFTLGGLGLYFELMNPGAIFPGVFGAICLILAFMGFSVLPFNYAGMALIVLAIILFVAEVKIVSYGMLTVAGVVCLVLGYVMLFKTADPALRVSLEVIVTLAVFTLAVVGFLLTYALRARRTPVRTGLEGLIHEVGTARSALAPRGKVFVHGEIWDAVSDVPVAPGEPVEILGVRNFTLSVRPRRPDPVG